MSILENNCLTPVNVYSTVYDMENNGAGMALKIEMWLGTDGQWKWALFERNGQSWDWLESGSSILMRDAADGAHRAYIENGYRIVATSAEAR